MSHARWHRRLIRETCARQGIDPGTLNLHADRGAVPKGKTVKQLLVDLDVTRSFSRPRVSNDNPFSEAEFRTMKYGPEYPDRFASYEDARTFCQRFFRWYNDDHRHSGIAYLTPSDVHYGRVADVLAQRQTIMDEAYARTPERFAARAPLHAQQLGRRSPDASVQLSACRAQDIGRVAGRAAGSMSGPRP